MTENDIQELIPLIGHRVVFLNYWKSKYCTFSTFNPKMVIPDTYDPNISISEVSQNHISKKVKI